MKEWGFEPGQPRVGCLQLRCHPRPAQRDVHLRACLQPEGAAGGQPIAQAASPLGGQKVCAQTPVSDRSSAFVSRAISNLEDLGTHRGPALCRQTRGSELPKGLRSSGNRMEAGGPPAPINVHTHLFACGSRGPRQPAPTEGPSHSPAPAALWVSSRLPGWQRVGFAAGTASCSSPIGKTAGGAELSFEGPVPLPGAQAPRPRLQARRKGVQPHNCLQPGVGAPSALSDQQPWLCNRSRGG